MSRPRFDKRRPVSSDEIWESNRHYGVIIDAGSSGSRVYVYSWKDNEYLRDTNESLKGAIPMVERADKNGLKWTTRQEPGISTYGSRPSEIGEHLQDLLTFALEVVPPQQQAATPIYLMATAGVRLLPDNEQQALMAATCKHIQTNTPFFISDCESHIKTIPGEIEGVYGWVAVNYLMGGFDLARAEEKKHTFGFLDMGGASAQIAFEPDHHQKEEHSSDLTKIHLRTLDGVSLDYEVFVTTFLGYGSNQARRRYLEDRVKTLFDHQTTEKPLLDDQHRLHLDDPCLPLNLDLTDTDSTSVSLQLKGTGQFKTCLEATLPLLNKNAECPTEPCLFNGVHTPKIDWSIHQFVGISEYWYSSHDVLGLGGVYDFRQYEEKATQFCGQNWTVILDTHPDWHMQEAQRYQLQCFKSAWMMNVLHGGIEVPRISESDDTWMEESIESAETKNWNPPFQSIDTINDIQVSWTLGAMLLHVANQIPLAPGSPGHSSHDEPPHEIVDGVELPSGEQHEPFSDHYWPSIPDDDDIMSSWWDVGNTLSVVALLGMLLVLIGVVLWEWRRHSHKRRRDYRRVDTNGGILGNTATPTVSPSRFSSTLSGALMAMKQVTARPMVVLRYCVSKILPLRYTSLGNANDLYSREATSPNGDTFHVGMADSSIFSNGEATDEPSTVIPMHAYSQLQQQYHHQQLQQQQPPLPSSSSNGNLMAAALSSQQQQSAASLGPSQKSASMISMKYWQKKRYSGDSHHIHDIMQAPSQDGFPTSAFASRMGSAANLVSRTASSSPALDMSTTTSGSVGMTMTRSRSRVGFTIHESLDEDDYFTQPTDDHAEIHRIASLSNLSRTPSPSQALGMTKRAASPKLSPRSSIEK
ncbi:hypothetical protein DM01DRAFT_1404151 [Hesseltinella vesiculosa]|uniref:Nucleoside phosphatase GDA1/CD39 n=1 Tax=Hesseltinella vesiculosa TaxID=101127 RepID=A0A1X2GTJ6_9FUNG|nr:hypothetical protein DM01DRAFT_1404151 [Hesseltinella vesiculosa]